jgi:hypothetical protein
MVQAPLAPTTETTTAIVQRPVAQLPWRHHTILLDKLAAPADRLWYAAKALENGWSRNVLALQIDSGLHTRQGKAVTNLQAPCLRPNPTSPSKSPKTPTPSTF